jgi:hypothetical protein
VGDPGRESAVDGARVCASFLDTGAELLELAPRELGLLLSAFGSRLSFGSLDERNDR